MESTFRLNLLNPQHAKINEVIKGLNPNIYKSKNQFLIEACEFYIDHYGDKDLSNADKWNGILYTGDLAYYDSDGFFYICGRKIDIQNCLGLEYF